MALSRFRLLAACLLMPLTLAAQSATEIVRRADEALRGGTDLNAVFFRLKWSY